MKLQSFKFFTFCFYLETEECRQLLPCDKSRQFSFKFKGGKA